MILRAKLFRRRLILKPIEAFGLDPASTGCYIPFRLHHKKEEL